MFREREGKRIMALAKEAGAKSVEFEYNPDGVKATIHLNDSTEKPIDANEWLTDDAHQA